MDDKQHSNDPPRVRRAAAGAKAEHEASPEQNAEIAVKNGISGGLRGIDQIEADTVTLVRNTVSNTIRATGSVAEDVIHVTRDVVKGVRKSGQDW